MKRRVKHGQWADWLIPAGLALTSPQRGEGPARSRLATKEPFPDRGAKRLIRATTAYAAFRSPGERSDAGSRSFTNAQHLRFRKAISVRARRQTRNPGAYIQYVTGVSERSQRGYGVNERNELSPVLPVDIVNGPGTRCTLFVSGCVHECPGCYNKAPAGELRYAVYR